MIVKCTSTKYVVVGLHVFVAFGNYYYYFFLLVICILVLYVFFVFFVLHCVSGVVLLCLAGDSRLDDRMVFPLSPDQVNLSTSIDCSFTLLLSFSLGK